jgi:hypothetical protein
VARADDAAIVPEPHTVRGHRGAVLQLDRAEPKRAEQFRVLRVWWHIQVSLGIGHQT